MFSFSFENCSSVDHHSNLQSICCQNLPGLCNAQTDLCRRHLRCVAISIWQKTVQNVQRIARVLKRASLRLRRTARRRFRCLRRRKVTTTRVEAKVLRATLFVKRAIAEYALAHAHCHKEGGAARVGGATTTLNAQSGYKRLSPAHWSV